MWQIGKRSLPITCVTRLVCELAHGCPQLFRVWPLATGSDLGGSSPGRTILGPGRTILGPEQKGELPETKDFTELAGTC